MCQNKLLKILTKYDQKKCQYIIMNEKFPWLLYIGILTWNIILGGLLIGFQSELVSVKGPYYYLATG